MKMMSRSIFQHAVKADDWPLVLGVPLVWGVRTHYRLWRLMSEIAEPYGRVEASRSRLRLRCDSRKQKKQ